jgi:hypothetical protein
MMATKCFNQKKRFQRITERGSGKGNTGTGKGNLGDGGGKFGDGKGDMRWGGHEMGDMGMGWWRGK